MSSEEVKINAICHTETEDTVTGHDRLLHRFRRDLCVDKNYIVYDQNYDDHDDEHFDVVPDFIPDFHNNFSPNFSSFMKAVLPFRLENSVGKHAAADASADIFPCNGG